MPVEIRELVIRAVTNMEQKQTEDTELERSHAAHESPDSTDNIIQECVRQVLRILRKEKER